MRKIGLLGLSIWILGLCVSVIAAAEHQWHLLTASNALRLTASEPQSGTLTYLDTIDRAFQETDWEPTSEGYQLIIPCPRTGLYQWNDQRIVAGITPGVTLHGTPVYVNGQEAIYTEKVMMEAFVLPGEDFAFAKAPLLSHAFAQGTYYYYEIAEEGDYHYTYGEETYHFYLDLSEPEVIMTPDLNDLELVFFRTTGISIKKADRIRKER